jgi:predicted nucleic acid-binding protein
VSLVLDTSATLAWVYMEERSEGVAAVLDRVTNAGAWVPSLWRLEVANVLEMGVRQGRIDAAFRDATLADLEFLPIQTDPDTEKQAWKATLRLAVRHRLTVYDAAYLELAMRRGLPLASLDSDLREAAKVEDVALLGA